MSEVSFCQTICFEAQGFDYETVGHENGNATVIKFKIDEANYSPGDVLLILNGEEINFHGIIGKIEDGYAYASDPRGSLLPAETIQ